jgi:hypothetical protein
MFSTSQKSTLGENVFQELAINHHIYLSEEKSI